MTFLAAVPQFTVADLIGTTEYYRDVLGFNIEGYFADPPVFGIVSRDYVQVFFSRGAETMRTGRAKEAYDVYIRVTEIDALAADLRGRGADIVDGPADRVYGQRELVIRDCNGLILAFGQRT